MDQPVALLVAALFATGALSACGGGGGNPGTCFGSAEVCAEGDNPNVATPTNTATGVTGAASAPTTTGTTTTGTTGSTGTSAGAN